MATQSHWTARATTHSNNALSLCSGLPVLDPVDPLLPSSSLSLSPLLFIFPLLSCLLLFYCSILFPFALDLLFFLELFFFHFSRATGRGFQFFVLSNVCLGNATMDVHVR